MPIDFSYSIFYFEDILLRLHTMDDISYLNGKGLFRIRKILIVKDPPIHRLNAYLLVIVQPPLLL